MKDVIEQIQRIYANNWGAGVDDEEEIILRVNKTKKGYSIRQLKEDRGGVIIRLPLKDLASCEKWINIFISD
jgi:hypothetical protein